MKVLLLHGREQFVPAGYTATAAVGRHPPLALMEEFLSTSPSLGYLLSPEQKPMRSSSVDDVVSIGSGATLPTALSMGLGFANFGSPQLPAHKREVAALCAVIQGRVDNC